MHYSIVMGPSLRHDLGETSVSNWRSIVEDAVLAEELGYDGFYVSEHHFGHSAGHSTPLMLLAEIAVRTSRIRIGTSIICGPLHQPLRLAEDLAAIDIMSNGRLEIGIGVGSQLEEFEAFGIDPKERFGRSWELIDFIEKCLSSPVEETFDWKGKYFQIPNIRWVMQPVQKPVPIAWGGFGPQGVARAAKRGFHLIAPDVTGEYARVMHEEGRDPRDFLVGISDIVAMGESKEDALEPGLEAYTWVSNQYGLRKGLDGSVPPPEHAVTADEVRERALAGKAGFALPKAGDKPAPFAVPIVGTASDMLDHYLKVVRGERGLITHIRLNVRQAGVPTWAVHRTMRMFAEEVLPALREEDARLKSKG